MTPVKITEEAPLRVRHARRPQGRRNDRRPRRSGEQRDGERRFTKRRHFSPNSRNRSENGQDYRRTEKKVHKEPNRSVFKPYFKD